MSDQQERILFDRFTQASTGMGLEAVMGAAMNLLINAFRQNYVKRGDAEAKYDELFGRGKQLLLANHYDSVTGLRRNVMQPQNQIIRMAYHAEDDIHDPRVKPNGR